MPLARSTWPLVLGCPTADQATRMWWSSQKRQELFAGELRPIVGDDGVGDPKPVDDVSEE